MPCLEIQVVQLSFFFFFFFGNMSTLVFCDFPGMPGFTTDIREILVFAWKSIVFKEIFVQ